MLQIEEYSKFLVSKEFKNYYQKMIEDEEKPICDDVDITFLDDVEEDLSE